MSIAENPYAPPQADLTLAAARPAAFFVVAHRKLLVTMLLSYGLYGFYWLYKHWDAYRSATGARVLPVVRAFFSIFFAYSLVLKIKRALDLKDASYRWWPRCFALGWIGCAFLPYTYIGFVSPLTVVKVGVCFTIVQVAVMVQIQLAVNHLEDDPKGEANSRFTWANGIWIVIGVSLWALGIASAFLTA